MKLNLGAGNSAIIGFVNVDRMYGDMESIPGYDAIQAEVTGTVFIHGDVYPLTTENYKCADLIRASHVLEHFPHGETQDIINNWTSALAENGWLKLAVPDFKYIVENYLAQISNLPLELYCMGGQTDANDFHYAIFDERSLRRMMTESGLVDIQRWESEIQDCAALPVSLNLMGRKPFEGEEIATVEEVAEKELSHIEIEGWKLSDALLDDRHGAIYKGFEYISGYGKPSGPIVPENNPYYRPRIKSPDISVIESVKTFSSEGEAILHTRECIDAIIDTLSLTDHPDPRYAGIKIPQGSVVPILTHPRFGPLEFMHCESAAFQKLGISLIMQGGAYWNQGIENLCEKAVENGAKYVLALDYDTIFDHRDIEVLYGIMEELDGIDALVPIQMRREMTNALFTIRDPETGENVPRVDSSVFDNDVTPIASGHLGLTIIRVEALKRTPKPWFHAVPSERGDWGDGHVDADIAFWLKFQEAGNKLYLANRVCVGHQENVVKWPDVNLEPILQQVSDYHTDGKPKKGSGVWE